jgi:hypothetical protein
VPIGNQQGMPWRYGKDVPHSPVPPAFVEGAFLRQITERAFVAAYLRHGNVSALPVRSRVEVTFSRIVYLPARSY